MYLTSAPIRTNAFASSLPRLFTPITAATTPVLSCRNAPKGDIRFSTPMPTPARTLFAMKSLRSMAWVMV
jgi:hypothetical protein